MNRIALILVALALVNCASPAMVPEENLVEDWHEANTTARQKKLLTEYVQRCGASTVEEHPLDFSWLGIIYQNRAEELTPKAEYDQARESCLEQESLRIQEYIARVRDRLICLAMFTEMKKTPDVSLEGSSLFSENEESVCGPKTPEHVALVCVRVYKEPELLCTRCAEIHRWQIRYEVCGYEAMRVTTVKRCGNSLVQNKKIHDMCGEPPLVQLQDYARQ